MRTCVGCRARAAKSELLRVVAVGDGPYRSLLVDLRGGAPGRGAHLHPTPDCLALAERRRAFPRALRVDGALDLAPLRAEIASRSDATTQTTPTRVQIDGEWSSS